MILSSLNLLNFVAFLSLSAKAPYPFNILSSNSTTTSIDKEFSFCSNLPAKPCAASFTITGIVISFVLLSVKVSLTVAELSPTTEVLGCCVISTCVLNGRLGSAFLALSISNIAPVVSVTVWAVSLYCWASVEWPCSLTFIVTVYSFEL